MDLAKPLAEREAERRRKREEAEAAARRRRGRGEPDEPETPVTNWHDYPSVSHLFDPVDVVFDFPGRISGMATSLDSRCSFV